MLQLVIADDHAIVRSGLCQIFGLMSDIGVAGEARNGGEVLALLGRHSPDLLLLDAAMPGINGADLIRQVRVQNPHLPILVLSLHDMPQVAEQMIDAGANGYITKNCEPGLLLAAVRKVAAGGNYIDPALAEKMAFGFHRNGKDTLLCQRHRALSKRELEVLNLLVDGHTVKDIGSRLGISGKTVSTHKLRLMEKLSITSMADLVRYAMTHGLDQAISL